MSESVIKEDVDVELFAPDGPARELTLPQLHALQTLALTGSVTEAAEAAGVARSTIYRWQDDEHFEAAQNEAEQKLIEHGSMQFATMFVAALRNVLGAIMDGDVQLSYRFLQDMDAFAWAALALGLTDPEGLQQEAEGSGQDVPTTFAGWMAQENGINLDELEHNGSQ